MRPVFIRSRSLPRAEYLTTLRHSVRPEKALSCAWADPRPAKPNLDARTPLMTVFTGNSLST